MNTSKPSEAELAERAERRDDGDMNKGAVIAAWLKAKITDGTYQAGTRLPRRQDISSKFGCSTGPVSIALGQLEVGGWIRRDGWDTAYIVATAEERTAHAEAREKLLSSDSMPLCALAALRNEGPMSSIEVRALFDVREGELRRWEADGTLRPSDRLPNGRRCYDPNQVMVLYNSQDSSNG